MGPAVRQECAGFVWVRKKMMKWVNLFVHAIAQVLWQIFILVALKNG